jgi:glycosyltransferase involved in cell wall biosynthesis
LERAQALAQTLGVADDLKFLDWVADEWLAPLYRQSRAFCLASREETFGRCVIEAMACGAACVVNDIPIMHEVTDGHALIVDFKNPAAVAESLTKLACDDSLLEKLRAEGQARAAEFTFERLATERIAAMQRLIVARRAGVEFTTRRDGALEQGAN